MATTIPAIFEFPGVTITREKRDMGVVKMLRRVRPDWRKEDIILQSFYAPEKGSLNVSLGKSCKDIIYGGYTSDKNEIVMVKIFQPLTSKDHIRNSLVKQMKVCFIQVEEDKNHDSLFLSEKLIDALFSG